MHRTGHNELRTDRTFAVHSEFRVDLETTFQNTKHFEDRRNRKDLDTSPVCQLNMNIIYSVIAGFDLVVSQDPRQQSRKFEK